MLEIAHGANAAMYSSLVLRDPENLREVDIIHTGSTVPYKERPVPGYHAAKRNIRTIRTVVAKCVTPSGAKNGAANLFDKIIVFGGVQRTVPGRVDGHY